MEHNRLTAADADQALRLYVLRKDANACGACRNRSRTSAASTKEKQQTTAAGEAA